jgi:hypothetical protein
MSSRRSKAKRLSWKIYYGDGTVEAGTSGADWKACRDEGVICIVEIFADGTRAIHKGGNIYWMIGDEIRSGHSREIPRPMVKPGLLVPGDVYAHILKRAEED